LSKQPKNLGHLGVETGQYPNLAAATVAAEHAVAQMAGTSRGDLKSSAAASVAAPATGPMALSFLGDRLEVRAVLVTSDAVDKLIAALEATKALLPKEAAN
jgi:hypothetical protein